MMSSQALLPYLQEVRRRLEQFDNYGSLDLALHAVCEGNLMLVDECKRAIAAAREKRGRISTYARTWVDQAIEDLGER